MSGVGAMMAGGNPADGRQDDDFYPTTPEPTHGLMRMEKFQGVIHECACGDGAMAEIIKAYGYKVVSSDLIDRGYGVQRDFFQIVRPVGHNIISNPPWDIAADFIEHGMTVLKPIKMAFLLKASYWHAAKRAKLFEKYPPAVIYPLTWRVDFLNKGRPVLECAWHVWHRGNTQLPRYQLMHKPKDLRALPIDTLATSAISVVA